MSRVSTFGVQSAAINQLMARQASATQTQMQLSTGLKLNTAKDDPVAAGVAVALQRAEAEYVRYGENSKVLVHRLSMEETALASVNDRLARVREIAIQANSGIQDEQSRNAFLAELREHKSALVALANGTDGQGGYLFAGSRDSSPPFSAVGGSVMYSGDQNRRRIEIAASTSVADVPPGSEVFMRVRSGSEGVTARPDGANTGTLTLRSAGMTDPAQWDRGQYRIEFEAGNYQVLDASGAVLQSGAFEAGSAIGFAGYQLTLGGVPADGDVFTVGPSPAHSVFDIVDDLIGAMAIPGQPATNQARQQNAFYAAIENLAQAQDHLIDLRSDTGARLATLDRGVDERESQLLSTRTTLSSLRDLDYAEAIGRLSREMATLEAAQLSFQRIQSLSLFSLMR